MSILTHDVIKKELKSGTIVIEPPVSDNQISVSSVDLHLSDEFRIYMHQDKAIDLKEETDYKEITKKIKSKTLVIRPGETVLGVTEEKITLPGNICGWLEGRSRFARLGLLIHISAGLIQPGVSNRQVLEITNLSPNNLMLYAGEKICQLVFQRCEGSAFYKGRFANQ